MLSKAFRALLRPLNVVIFFENFVMKALEIETFEFFYGIISSSGNA